MTLKRDPSMALQLGFLALLLISTAQVGWWMYDHVSKARDVSAGSRPSTSTTRTRSRRCSRARRRSGSRSTFRRSRSPAARPWYGPRRSRHSPTSARRRINRFLWEGAFFLAVLLGGMAVLTRTIRHDAELRRRQQNFLAAVSHEFKSPLASIQLASETLVLRSRESDTQRLGRRILEDCERLLRMVDNLLDTTRLEEGRQRLAPQPSSRCAARRRPPSPRSQSARASPR